MSRPEIEDDRKTPLDVLKHDLNGSISSALVKIQEYKLQTEDEWVEYVANLPCVITPATQEREPKRRRTDNGNETWLPKRDLKWTSINAFDCRDYAAVSYRWKASSLEDEARGRYRCMRVGAQRLEGCPVRDQLIDRVTSFLHSTGCELFWIDQICVNQLDDKERQSTMQAWHAVYRQSNFPVAILSTPIQTQEELDLLFTLVRGRLPSHWFKTTAAAKALALIKRLIDDPWWDSAWTHVEDNCAPKMVLLIPHHDSLNILKQRSPIGYLFGSLDNELCVSSVAFRTGVNNFCTKYMDVYPFRISPSRDCEHILRVAPRYITLLRDKNNEGWVSMSPYILADLVERRMEVSGSTIAAAILCDYTVGIREDAMNEGWSPSLVMLAQYVLNGEVLPNNRGRRYSLKAPVFEYLKEQSLETHQPPIDSSPFAFIKSARLSVTGLTEDGIMTRGRLWKLSEVFEVQTEGASTGWEDSSDHGLSGYQRKRLKDLAVAVEDGDVGYRYPQLPANIWRYLQEDESQGSNVPPSKLYMDTMAKELVRAMDAEVPLRFGRLVNENDRNPSSYRGIFIWDPEMTNEETHVFTSFADGRNSWRDLQRHVSIGVHVDEETRHLYTGNWLNGLIFAWGERTSNFLFPWPTALGEE